MQTSLLQDSKKDKGFTLIDTVIAMVILLIAISSSISGLSLAYKAVANQKIRIIKMIENKNLNDSGFQNVYP